MVDIKSVLQILAGILLASSVFSGLVKGGMVWHAQKNNESIDKQKVWGGGTREWHQDALVEGVVAIGLLVFILVLNKA